MQTRQRIGVAVGILMQQYDLDEDRAFQYWRGCPRTATSKLRDIADEVVNAANERNAIPAAAQESGSAG